MKQNHIDIIRDVEITGLDGNKIQTIGELTLYKDDSKADLLFNCKTLERGWVRNVKDVSCIPPAPTEICSYKWRLVEYSPMFSYKHIHILDVPNRTGIKIHKANKYQQLLGCVAVGMRFGYLSGDDDVLDVLESREAMEKLVKSLTTTEGTITIHSKVNQRARVPSINFADEILSTKRVVDLDDDLV